MREQQQQQQERKQTHGNFPHNFWILGVSFSALWARKEGSLLPLSLSAPQCSLLGFGCPEYRPVALEENKMAISLTVWLHFTFWCSFLIYLLLLTFLSQVAAPRILSRFIVVVIGKESWLVLTSPYEVLELHLILHCL